MDELTAKLIRVCAAFGIPGEFQSCEEIKVGNVNRTYRVNFMRPGGKLDSYIAQEVNTYVFREPVKVMENIDRVTGWLQAAAPESTVLHFHHTRAGNAYMMDGDAFWRLCDCIPSVTYNVCDDLRVVRSAGAAFGGFQTLLAGFDAAQLHCTIPDFHNTRKRYAKLIADVRADPCGRAAEVQEELDWLLSVMDRACTLTDMHERGELPLRVTHNDTKINNVLFDRESGEAIAVIDLDTVMPGLVGHDFGDAIRFAANRAEEDCPDAERAGVNMDVFRAFTEGFVGRTHAALTCSELDTLALSCFALACELAARFLDDYILGDLYFRTEYPGHNLVRARCQIALARDMLARMSEMEAVVRECAAQCR